MAMDDARHPRATYADIEALVAQLLEFARPPETRAERFDLAVLCREVAERADSRVAIRAAVERAGMGTLNDGQKVSYEVHNDPKRGKSSAENLKAV